MLDIRYRCPRCGHKWEERYESACDSECGECGMESISPLMHKGQDETWSPRQRGAWKGCNRCDHCNHTRDDHLSTVGRDTEFLPSGNPVPTACNVRRCNGGYPCVSYAPRGSDISTTAYELFRAGLTRTSRTETARSSSYTPNMVPVARTGHNRSEGGTPAMASITVNRTMMAYRDPPRHNKFWTIELVGKFFFVTYGRIGTNGTTQRKEFPTNVKALVAYHKKIHEKSLEGYCLEENHPSAPQDQIDHVLQMQDPNHSAPQTASTTTRPPTVAPTPTRRTLDLRGNVAQHTIEITVGKDGLKEATVKRLVKLLQKDLGKTATVASRKVERCVTRAERCSAAFAQIEDAKAELEALKEELEEWKDNLPENLQDGEKAQELDTAVSQLEDIIHELGNLADMDGSVEFPSMM